MEIIICDDTDEVGRLAGALFADVCARKPDAVLGLATGSSPLACYADLARRVDEGLDVSRVRGFALDEYVGIPESHPQSYASTIRRTVVEPLKMNPALVHVPDGRSPDIPAACADYERMIATAGGIDVQILGIGSNGHIGFNEPSSSLSSRTRIKTLTRSTREDNQRFFDSLDDVPTHCLTQGLGTIMDARQVVLVANGANKARAIADAVEGPVSAMCPASVLQFHRHVTVIVDADAGAELVHADYYREVFAGKPSWQRL